MAQPIVVDLVASVNKRANENQFVGMPCNLFLLSRHFAERYCNSINIKDPVSPIKHCTLRSPGGHFCDAENSEAFVCGQNRTI